MKALSTSLRLVAGTVASFAGVAGVAGVAVLAGSAPLVAADAVVGTGTPASCTEMALDAGLAAVNSGGGTLTFDCGGQPHAIVVTGTKLLQGAITLSGAGKITLSGGFGTRILGVQNGSDVLLDGIVLTHGFASGAPGGAILVSGSSAIDNTRLTLVRSAIRDSVAGTWGGGLAATNARISLNWSSVAGNSAGGGGGGINLNVGVLQLFECEIADNSSGGSGGGVEFWTGELYVDGTSFDRNVASNVAADASGGGMSIRDLPLASIEQSRFARNSADFAGGGVEATGATELLLYDVEFEANEAPAGVGGAIRIGFAAAVAGGNVTFAGNRAVQGGGIDNSGAIVFGNATMSGNIATGGVGGAISNSGDLDLTHVTVAGNQAVLGGGIYSGSIGTPVTHLKNVLFAGNADVQGFADCAFEIGPSSIVFSLWSDASCGSSGANGNQPNTALALPPLALNCFAPGGILPTRTHLPSAGSAAVDQGSCELPDFALDQRGVARPQGLACDVGAVERADPPACAGLFLDGFEGQTTYRWSDRSP